MMRQRRLPALLARGWYIFDPRAAAWWAMLTVFLFRGADAYCQSQGSPTPTADPFEELRIRIEQLEQDNRDLRSALTKRGNDPFVSLMSDVDVAALPPAPEEPDEVTPPQDQKLEGLVEGMIRRLNAQSQAAADAQDRRIAAMEGKLESALKKNPRGANGIFGNAGLMFTSNDGNFKTHFGGTAQLDFIAPQSSASGIGNLGGPAGAPVTGSQTNGTQDSVYFRRLRVRADGTMYGWIDWASEFDFAFALQNTSTNGALADNGLRNTTSNGGSGAQAGNTMNAIQPTIVFMTFNDVVGEGGNIRIGNQQDWFSLEHINSARYLDFMERAPIMDAFSGPNNNGYVPGVSYFGSAPDKLAGLQLGIYKNNDYDSGFPYSIGNAWTYGGRLFALPYYDECSDGRYLVHTAIGTEYRSFDTSLPSSQSGDNIRVRSRGDLRIASSTLTPNFSDTGNFFTLGQTLIDPELAIVWGSWTIKAEYTASWFNGARNIQGGTKLGGVFMSGGYAEALYFLTGENSIYNRQTGMFMQVIPKDNVNFSQGQYGAWQVGLRYDWMDLNSGAITGGRNQDVTFGLNWWINPNIRFQFNTVGTYINNATPTASTNGSLAGSQFTGDGLLVTLGTRIDISY